MGNLFFSSTPDTPENEMRRANKAELIAKAAATQPTPRRRGVDKAKLAGDSGPPISIFEDESQVIDLSSTQVVEDTPIMDESEEDDSADEAFNAEAEEIFLDKLDSWFADYAPKLFDLGLAKFLSKQEKRKKKSDTEESSETSRRRPSKKSRS